MALPLRQFANRLGGMGLCYPRGARINWDHPITNGLVAYYLLGDQLGDKVTGSPLTFNPAASGTTSYGLGPSGPDWLFPNATQSAGLDSGFHTSYCPLTKGGALNMTIAGLAMVYNGGGTVGQTGSPLYGERAPSGLDLIKLCYTSTGQGDCYKLVIRDDGNTLLQASLTSAAAASDGKYHSIAVTKQGNGASNINGYYDGSPSAGNPFTWSGTTNFTDASMSGIVGACDNQDSTGPFPGHVVYAAVWSRVLSVDEIVSLANDPWQFLIPVDTIMPAIFPVLPPAVGMPIYASNIQYLNRTIGY